MAIDTGKPLVSGAILDTVLTTIYTAPSTVLRVKFDAVTFVNYGGANAALTVQIVESGASAGDGKIVINAREIRAGESYLAPEIIGQAIAVGGTLQAFSSVATSINCLVTGTIYT
jgi:hypothetical protein